LFLVAVITGSFARGIGHTPSRPRAPPPTPRRRGHPAERWPNTGSTEHLEGPKVFSESQLCSRGQASRVCDEGSPRRSTTRARKQFATTDGGPAKNLDQDDLKHLVRGDQSRRFGKIEQRLGACFLQTARPGPLKIPPYYGPPPPAAGRGKNPRHTHTNHGPSFRKITRTTTSSPNSLG